MLRKLQSTLLLIILASLFTIVNSQTLQHFTFTSNTGSNGTVEIQTIANPSINGTPLAAGDEIGIFTPAGLCVGAVVWNNANTSIAVWEDDYQTGTVDGILPNELMSFRVWDQSSNTEITDVSVTYDPTSPFNGTGLYQPNNFYRLLSLSATSTLEYTVTTSPVGLSITVDGTTYTSPQTFNWIPGSSHDIGTTTPQGNDSTRNLFGSWSDGGAITHSITAPGTPTTYTATFTTEHYLTMTAGTGGTVATASSWRAAGSLVQIYALAYSGYSFTGWTGTGNGSYTGTNNPEIITMNGPITENASFTIAQIIAPSNLTAVVDTFAILLNWNDNSNYEFGFYIERKNGDSLSVDPFGVIDTVAANIESFNDLGRTPNTTYTYRIRAFNIYVVSPYSNQVTATTIIPVELTTLKATQQERSVLLEWTTVTELNNKGFDVERKTDKNWETLTSIPGAGTTTEIQHYNYLDKFDFNTFSGVVRYRLKQIDYDGTFSSSDEIEITVDFNPKEFVLLQNFPNPFNPITTINYSIPTAGIVQLKVFNIHGEDVLTLVNEEKRVGNYQANFNAINFASGVYFYRLQAGDNVQTRKMILLK